MVRRSFRLLLGAGCLGGLVLVLLGLASSDDYTTTFVFPDAANVIAGGRVQVDGVEVGRVRDVGAVDGLAHVRVTLDDEVTPLRSGTQARIEYRALLGERVLELDLAELSEPELPDGAVIEGNLPRVDLDEVLNALTPEVRADVGSLIREVDDVLSGREQHLTQAIDTAGPAVEAIGAVLAAIGRDGPALRRLVTETGELAGRLSARDDDLAAVIDGLEASMAAVAARDQELARALQELPGTLQAAGTTLESVPPTVDVTLPLVRDLRGVTTQLPDVAAELDPVLRDLRPVAHELRELAPSARELLGTAPGLLDGVAATAPRLTEQLELLVPAVDFLRPYTPELVGFMSNWASFYHQYDANGRYARVWLNEGSGSLTETPLGLPLPGSSDQGRRPPGAVEGQPWHDASGSPIR